jgi:hypothetical protein
MSILLDYVFNVSSIIPTPAASASFLKKVLVVVKPVATASNTIHTCTTSSQIAALTNNLDAVQLLNAGMSSVYVLDVDDLDIATIVDANPNMFYTILISSDFNKGEITDPGTAAVAAYLKVQDILYTAKTAGVAGNDITIKYVGGNTAGAATVSVASKAIEVSIETNVTTAATIASAIASYSAANALVACSVDVGDETDSQAAFTPAVNLAHGADAIPSTEPTDFGTFDGVVGIATEVANDAKTYAAIANVVGFYSVTANKAKNLFYAFGKLLSNELNWNNQQYITMPYNDLITELGDAEDLFDSKASFVINDSQYGNKLGLLACGGKAIVAPYIIKNLEIDLQSAALTYISGNQPQYTKREAALLENALKDVIQQYVDLNWIEQGTIAVELIEDNFVANGSINVAEPKALWRVFAEIRQTL